MCVSERERERETGEGQKGQLKIDSHMVKICCRTLQGRS